MNSVCAAVFVKAVCVNQSDHSNNLTVKLAFASFILLGMMGGLIGVAWPAIRTELGLRLDAVGTLLLASTLGYLSASFLTGPVAYRIGAGRMFALGSAFILAGMAMYAIGASWYLFIAASFVAGLGSGTLDGGLNAYVAAHYSTRAMNWLHAFFGIGVTISPLFVTAALNAGAQWIHAFWSLDSVAPSLIEFLVFKAGTWRGGYLIVGLVAIVMTVLLALNRNRFRAVVVESSAPKRGVSAFATLRLPQVWFGIFMFVFAAGVEATPGQWTFSLFTQARGIDTVSAGFWVSVYWGSFTIGRMLFGTYLPKISNANLLRICIAVAIVGALLLWWNPLPAVGFVGLVLLGFAQAPIFPVLVSETPRYIGVGHSQNAIGFQVSGAGLGIAGLPSFAGVLAAAVGLEVISPFVLAGLVALFILHEFRIAYHAAHPLVREAFSAGD
jgi:fucose permease